MKKLIILLSIFLASILVEPLAAASFVQDQTELFGGGPKIKHHKFKTHKKRRRGARTCLNKHGCKKHKIFKKKSTSCSTY